MSGNDQEQFTDYLELEGYIEDLQAERAARLPVNLSPEHARLYRMAALLHSASPENPLASQPRPEFVAALQEHLLAISQGQDAALPMPTGNSAQAQDVNEEQREDQHISIQQPAPVLSPEAHPPKQPETALPPRHPARAPSRPRVSRRGLLAGGAAAAASLAVGVGIGALVNQPQPQESQPLASDAQEQLDPTGPTTWLFVATLTQLSQQAVKFTSNATIGYVMLNDPSSKESVTALSATCTHMGCIINWQAQDHQFHCPCHSGLFDQDGKPAPESPIAYLKPLPRLKTKIEDGKVYVEVPASDGSSA